MADKCLKLSLFEQSVPSAMMRFRADHEAKQTAIMC